jgi:hypothetical protein
LITVWPWVRAAGFVGNKGRDKEQELNYEQSIKSIRYGGIGDSDVCARVVAS